MKAIQMTIDERLLEEVDRAAAKRGTSRSEFVRQALEAALERGRVTEMEERHRRGYEKHPVTPEEFEVWVPEQYWGEE